MLTEHELTECVRAAQRLTRPTITLAELLAAVEIARRLPRPPTPPSGPDLRAAALARGRATLSARKMTREERLRRQRECMARLRAARRQTKPLTPLQALRRTRDLSYANLCRLRMKRLWNERRGLPTTGLPPRIRKRRTAL